MDRRAFITVVGGTVLVAPLVAEAQQVAKIPPIGHRRVAAGHKNPS